MKRVIEDIKKMRDEARREMSDIDEDSDFEDIKKERGKWGER